MIGRSRTSLSTASIDKKASIDLVVDGKSSKCDVGPVLKKLSQSESKKAGSRFMHARVIWSRPPDVPPALFMSEPARIRWSISVTSAGRGIVR